MPRFVWFVDKLLVIFVGRCREAVRIHIIVHVQSSYIHVDPSYMWRLGWGSFVTSHAEQKSCVDLTQILKQATKVKFVSL